MGAASFVLGGAILGLFWGGYPSTIATSGIDGLCDLPACVCDLHGRLTCDCKEFPELQELTLSANGDYRLSPHTSRILIRDCPSVILMNSSLSSMSGLRSIELRNISNLTLFTQSFDLSPKTARALVSIHNARISILPSFVFRGDMESISFENVEIGVLSAFAFANLAGTDTLRLEDCEIDTIEEQAFKKFDVNFLHIIGGSFGQVPSRTMNDIEVFTTFRIDGVSMGIVRSSAFVIKKPKTVSMQNCIVEALEAEAFDISTRGAVLIRNNKFGSLAAGAFLGIRADPDSPVPSDTLMPEVAFTNNSLDVFEEGSVMFDRASFHPIIDQVFINHTCDCNLLSTWKNNVLNYTNVFTRFYTGNSLLQSAPEPVEEGTFLCVGDKTKSAISFREFEARNCALGNSTMLFLLLLVVLTLVLIVTLGILIWCCRRHHSHGGKRWISVPTSAPDVVSKKNGVIGRDGATQNTPVDSRITMVVPDGRLYRETEFHVIVEKAEPLTTEL